MFWQRFCFRFLFLPRTKPSIEDRSTLNSLISTSTSISTLSLLSPFVKTFSFQHIHFLISFQRCSFPLPLSPTYTCFTVSLYRSRSSSNSHSFLFGYLPKHKFLFSSLHFPRGFSSIYFRLNQSTCTTNPALFRRTKHNLTRIHSVL